MNYNEVLDYMYEQLPMFHRVGPAAYKPGLDNTIALLQLVNNPERHLKCVHVAGTNGKGSTSHMIASVLQQAGYKTGLYTSPHLKDFRERIKINGIMIGQQDVVLFITQYKDQWKHLQPSFFEITVALAFWYFQQEATDINVIEVGLGGRLDSTNVILPEVSVITNIGMDHMNLLGNTIELIAAEKAGIIKENIPVVIGEMRNNAKQVIAEEAHSKQATLVDSSALWDHEVPACEMQGHYQNENRKTAFAALKVLQENGWHVSDKNIQDGFASVIRNTGLMGRWQVLQQQPLVVADVAHNADGITYVLQQIDKTPHAKLHFVLGLVADKEVDLVLNLLPQQCTYYFCKAAIPRAMAAAELQERAAGFNLLGQAYNSVTAAYEAAKRNASANDLVFVGGSVFVVGEVL
jgi:dihydrofolate synthase/folylpolyglutamate synthase